MLTPELTPAVESSDPVVPTPVTPSEPAAEPVVETVTPQEPQTPTEALYDLPDGRKVPGSQVKAEYENLLKDYTQKSQRLAEIERAKNPQQTDVPEWQKDGWVPGSYKEVVELAKQEAILDLKRQEEAAQNHSKEVMALVDSQIEELKKTDAALDENALFQHASKYGFRDLKSAHSNMQAIKQAALDAEQRTLKNVKSRGADPVSGQPGITVESGAIDPNITQKYGSALEYFRAIRGN